MNVGHLNKILMDDGSKICGTYKIATNCFSISELQKFQYFLLTKFNLLTASNFLVLYMYKNNTKYLYSSIIGLMDCIKTFNFSAKRV